MYVIASIYIYQHRYVETPKVIHRYALDLYFSKVLHMPSSERLSLQTVVSLNLDTHMQSNTRILHTQYTKIKIQINEKFQYNS